jgi:hypothetical protein
VNGANNAINQVGGNVAAMPKQYNKFSDEMAMSNIEGNFSVKYNYVKTQ